jgi:hypothetical protein
MREGERARVEQQWICGVVHASALILCVHHVHDYMPVVAGVALQKNTAAGSCRQERRRAVCACQQLLTGVLLLWSCGNTQQADRCAVVCGPVATH